MDVIFVAMEMKEVCHVLVNVVDSYKEEVSLAAQTAFFFYIGTFPIPI